MEVAEKKVKRKYQMYQAKGSSKYLSMIYDYDKNDNYKCVCYKENGEKDYNEIKTKTKYLRKYSENNWYKRIQKLNDKGLVDKEISINCSKDEEDEEIRYYIEKFKYVYDNNDKLIKKITKGKWPAIEKFYYNKKGELLYREEESLRNDNYFTKTFELISSNGMHSAKIFIDCDDFITHVECTQKFQGGSKIYNNEWPDYRDQYFFDSSNKIIRSIRNDSNDYQEKVYEYYEDSHLEKSVTAYNEKGEWVYTAENEYEFYENA